MAIKTEKLTHSFLSKHPDTAARVLEKLEYDDVVELFEDLPARIIYPVIRSMLPVYASKILIQLDADRQAAVANELDARIAANLIRNWPLENRISLLRMLPKRHAVNVRLLINYPAGSVGSLMNTEIVTAHMNQTLGEIEQLLRKADTDHQSEIYIVDDNQKLKGALSVMRVLREDGQKKARQVMEKKIPTVLATSHISYVIGQVNWETRNILPVIDRNYQIVGLLQKSAILEKPDTLDLEDSRFPSLLNDILGAYWSGWKSMFGVIVSNSAFLKKS